MGHSNEQIRLYSNPMNETLASYLFPSASLVLRIFPTRICQWIPHNSRHTNKLHYIHVHGSLLCTSTEQDKNFYIYRQNKFYNYKTKQLKASCKLQDKTANFIFKFVLVYCSRRYHVICNDITQFCNKITIVPCIFCNKMSH